MLTTTSPTDGLSIGRKVLENGFEQDTGNNSEDFEIQNPTPRFQNIKWTEPILPTLESIEITTSPTKTSFFVGEELDITGLVVEGIYVTLSEDGEIPAGRKEITITKENIIGFDSSLPVGEQILTIDFNGFTATYTIEILPDIMAPKILSYTLQVFGEEPTEDSSVIINSSNGVKIKIITDEPSKFEIWINNKKYWHTDNYVTDFSRPSKSNGCEFWTGTKNSCTGDTLPNGEYIIEIYLEDMAGNKYEDKDKIISVNNSVESL